MIVSITCPDRTDLGMHDEGGPNYLVGTWENTRYGINPVTIRHPRTVAFMDENLWITDGNGKWAGVRDDGRILGYIAVDPRLTMTLAREMPDGDSVFHVMWDLVQRTFVRVNAPAVRSGNPTARPEYDATQRPIHTNHLSLDTVASSRWNGTCPRCGRGTYTGAWDVEHEGGKCT